MENKRWSPTERALWAVEVLRAGKMLTPHDVAQRTGISQAAARGMLNRLSTTLPIENDGGLWCWRDGARGDARERSSKR
jgi:DNA-binding IclR family transcriptional regulator